MRRAASIAFVAVWLVGAIGFMAPFLRGHRPVATATPSLAGVFNRAVVPVGPGDRLCVSPVGFDRRTARVRVLAKPALRAATTLVVTASGPGYRSGSRLEVPASQVDQVVTAPLAPPGRPLEGSVCLRNAGAAAVGFVGTSEGRSLVPAATTVNGKPAVDQDIALTLLEARDRTLLQHLGAIVSHASGFTGGAVPAWLGWILLVLTVVALVAGPVVALAISLNRRV